MRLWVHGRVVLWREAEHEDLTDAVWDEATVEAKLAGIIADAEQAPVDGIWPGHPQDEEAGKTFRTFYLGSAGMIWGLARLGSSFGEPGLLEDLIAGYRAEPEFGPLAHPPSLWMGETGLLLVAAEVGSAAADPRRLLQLIRENREHGTWELMWGSPDTMLAAQACGLDDEYRDRTGEQRAGRVGHGRYTLFTGDIGVALYLRACVSGDPAFPTIHDL